MKKTIPVLLSLLLATAVTNLSAAGSRSDRHEQKGKPAKTDSLRHLKAARALEDHAWVLQADRYAYGTRIAPETNFLTLDGRRLVVQISLERGGDSFSGQAEVVKFKGKKARKGRSFFRFDLSSVDRVLDRVELFLEPGSDRATALVYFDPDIASRRKLALPVSGPSRYLMLEGAVKPFGEREILSVRPVY